MISSYHNHTSRCRHAVGTEREYVERAIASGLRIFGFSDHTPYPFPKEYDSHIRMRVDEFDDYVHTVLALKKEYEKDIEIHLGLEAEYYPAYFEDYLRLIEPYPIEYIILGQHYMENEIGGSWNGYPSDDLDEFRAYTKQLIAGMDTGIFTYVAHPDLYNYIGSNRAAYLEEARKICVAAKAHKLPLEINLHGIDTRRNYPNPAFFAIAAEIGNEVVICSDAHAPEEVYVPAAVQAAEAMVEELGLTLLTELPLPSGQ